MTTFLHLEKINLRRFPCWWGFAFQFYKTEEGISPLADLLLPAHALHTLLVYRLRFTLTRAPYPTFGSQAAGVRGTLLPFYTSVAVRCCCCCRGDGFRARFRHTVPFYNL